MNCSNHKAALLAVNCVNIKHIICLKLSLIITHRHFLQILSMTIGPNMLIIESTKTTNEQFDQFPPMKAKYSTMYHII